MNDSPNNGFIAVERNGYSQGCPKGDAKIIKVCKNKIFHHGDFLAQKVDGIQGFFTLLQ